MEASSASSEFTEHRCARVPRVVNRADPAVEHREHEGDQDAEEQPTKGAAREGQSQARHRTRETRLRLKGLEVVGRISGDVSDPALQRTDLIKDDVALRVGRLRVLHLGDCRVDRLLEAVDLPLPLSDEAVADVGAERVGRRLSGRLRHGGRRRHRLDVDDRARRAGLCLQRDGGGDRRLSAQYLLVGRLVEVVDVAE